MAKSVDDAALDALLTNVSGQSTELYLTIGAATSRADAITKAVNAAVAPGTVTGPANGTPNGREINYGALSGILCDAQAGTIDHIALCSGTTLKLVTQLASNVIVALNDLVDLTDFTHTVQDPQ